MESSPGHPRELVLASASPRRAELLKQLGLKFRVVAVDVDEEAVSRGLTGPSAVVRSRAEAKAGRAAGICPAAVVVAADTVVACGGRILGKPAGVEDAEGMLRRLSGRWHTVFTGLAVACGGEPASAVEYARVAFRSLDDDEIRRYAASAEPRDKAGAYAIQGAAAAFVRRIEGEYTTVVGLPLCRLGVMLRPFGFRFPA